ncbi:MAG: hypothetical protein ACRC33_05590 [Gemmataceae bacterium]
MRRPWSCPLAALLLAGVAAADTPFEGTWKVLLPQPRTASEATAWLLKIDKAGKKLEIVAGIDKAFTEAAVSGVVADGRGLRFTLTPAKGLPHGFVVMPPPKDDRESARGSVTVGGGAVAPVWLEKTELTEIDRRTAVQKVGALGDLQAAMGRPDPDARQKELLDVARAHLGRPVGIFAHQQLFAELMRTKANAPAFRDAVAGYVRTSKLFGPRLELAHRLQMANALRGTPDLLPVSLENAEAAVKMLDREQPNVQHLSAYLSLTSTLAALGKKADADGHGPKVKELVEAILKEAGDQKVGVMMSLAGTLVGSPAGAVADLGLEYARKGHAGLEKDAPPARKLGFDKFLRDALAARGQKAEADRLTAVIDAAEAGLDAAFEKANVPFAVKPFAGRKGKSGRAVLVEVFTGAQCPPCVSADIAFDAALKAYGPNDVVFLQYHLHIPGPDALTAADGEARQRYYGNDLVRGTPAALIDGQPGPELGGGRPQAEGRYGDLTQALASALEAEAGAKIVLTAKRGGEKVRISADVSGLASPGEKVRLRFVLVEEVARFTGANGQRLHHHVVRAFPGGPAGFALDQKEARHAAVADVGAVRKAQAAYLAAYRAKTGTLFREVPLALKRLKVVAFVQDDESQKVLQAAQTDVE